MEKCIPYQISDGDGVQIGTDGELSLLTISAAAGAEYDDDDDDDHRIRDETNICLGAV